MEISEDLVKEMLGELRALKSEVKSLVEKSKDQKIDFPIEERISDLLKDMGIPNHLKGYSYLREAIRMVCEDIGTAGSKVNVLYREVAMVYGTKPSCVERSVRHALSVSWDRENRDLKRTLFGNTLDLGKEKPTNGMFIMTCAEFLKQGEKAKVS